MKWTAKFSLCTILCCILFSLGRADRFIVDYDCDTPEFTELLWADCGNCKIQPDGTVKCNGNNKEIIELGVSMVNEYDVDRLDSTVIATWHSPWFGDVSQTLWKDVDACKGSSGSNIYCPTCPMKPNEPQYVDAFLDISKYYAPEGFYSLGISITFYNLGKKLCTCTTSIDDLYLKNG